MTKELKNKLVLIIIFFVAAFIPLVVKFLVVPVNSEEFSLIRNNQQATDVFSNYKAHLIIFSGTMICIVYLIYFLLNIKSFLKKKEESEKDKKRDGDIKTSTKIKDKQTSVLTITKSLAKKPHLALSMLFLIFVLLSTIFSEYPVSSLFGVMERYEGVFVVFCYIILFVVTIDCAKTKTALKFILSAVLFSAFIIFMIGLSQFLGRDFWVSDLGKKILLPGRATDGIDVKPLFDSAYATLYNPNCLGLYCAMILPVAISIALKSLSKKNIYLKTFSVIFLVLAFINLFASKSAGGLVGAIAALIFMSCIYISYILRDKNKSKKFLSVFFCLCVLFVGIVFVTPIKNNFCNMIKKFSDTSEKSFFNDISLKDNILEISYRSGKIKLEADKTKTNLINLYENNKLLPYETEKKDNGIVYVYNPETLESLNINVSPSGRFSLKLNNTVILLSLEKNKLFLLNNKGKKIALDIPVEHSKIFDGHELFASSRGYIWSRTLPLIKKNIFIGSGPDTFVFDFPQNDIIGKLKFHDSPYIIVDKPHNFYLQIIINTGLISLVVLMCLFCCYFFVTLRFLLAGTEKNLIQLGLSGGIVGYLTASLATDSVVSVAPVFWILIGLSFALNFINTNKENGS